MRAPAAAGSFLEFGGIAHSLGCFCFFILWKGFAFVFAFRQAAIRCLAAVSALIPMAQMKPNSSRPTGDDLWFLKRAHELSSKLRRDASVDTSWHARSFSITLIGPPHRGQCHSPVATGGCCEHGCGESPSNWRQRQQSASAQRSKQAEESNANEALRQNV